MNAPILLFQPIDVLWPTLATPRHVAARNMIQAVQANPLNVEGRGVTRVVKDPFMHWLDPMKTERL